MFEEVKKGASPALTPLPPPPSPLLSTPPPSPRFALLLLLLLVLILVLIHHMVHQYVSNLRTFRPFIRSKTTAPEKAREKETPQ